MAGAQGLHVRTCVLLMVLAHLLKPAEAFFSYFSPSNLYCSLKECCEEEKPYSSTAVLQDLNTNLFGQHLAHEIIFKALTGFLSEKNPKKPLALVMHGWTGTGKSHVSKIIVNNIYELGMESKSVHLFLPLLHFPSRKLVSEYKVQLQSWIRGNVSNCARSIFIFDETDKLHPGIIDAIKPFLDYHDKIEGVSYRKAIFLFLSNQDGNLINKKVLEYWKMGKDREEIKLQDLESGVSLELYNNINSGFWRSTLIKQNMIDFFIPFLPLERRHVKMCINAELRQYGLPLDEVKNTIDKVADMLEYDPKEYKLFSVSGCKNVPNRVTLVLKLCQMTTPPSCK